MKTFTFRIRSFVQSKKLLLTLLGFGFWGLNAQNSLTDIIPAGSTVIKLSSNQFSFTEGPVWNDSVLLFVDDGLFGMASNIYQYDPIGRLFTKWPSNSTHCTGLSSDKAGNIIGASGNILLVNKAGQLVKTLASGFNGKSFNNPNDLIADDKEGVYFTDPDFFLTAPPQDKTAVYYIDSTGNVKRVIDDLAEPNGLALSPDGTKLYIVETKNKYVYSYDIATDGSVSGKLSLAELQTGVDSYADGMAIDINGNIYVAGDQGIQVFSAQGAPITTIALPETPSNCDFGGKDFKTLYITALTNLYSIDLNYPGYAVSRKDLSNAIISISMQPVVQIYPNPAGDFLRVQFDPGSVNSFEILTMDGKLESISMNKGEGSDIEIDTQKLNPGMYFLRMIYNDSVVTRKFIKE